MTSPFRDRSLFATAMIAALLDLGCLHAADAPPRAIVAPAPAPTTAAPAPDARTAVQRALGFLEKDGAWWMAGGKGVPGGGGCVSCHQVPFGIWAHREAQRAGVRFDRAGVDQLEKDAHAFYIERPRKAEPVPVSQLMLARELPTDTKDGAGPRWTASQRRLIDDQQDDGRWESAGQFSSQKRPEAESDAVATMWILVAFGSFEGLDPAVAASRDRAHAWVKKSPPGVSNEWLATRLLVERRLGDPKTAQALLDRLLREQHPDGGWSWLAKDPSNAFSTGQTLYALAGAGLDHRHPAVRRGIGYLLHTQAADGTWITPSRLTSNKGEEGGKIEYIYKYWGTAWAVIGLARTLAPAPVAAR
jgi:hypothetical protein